MAFDVIETGNKIRILRESKKWSQFKLGDQLDLSSAYIGKLERGESIARIWVYLAIAELFEVSLDYLLTNKPKDSSREKLQMVIGILEGMEYEL